jgi:glycosyltransferase involved in cell wall biosynthesis
MRYVGTSRGHLWEQVELPWHARSGFLVSLANAAPLLGRRQSVTIHDASVFAVPAAYSRAYRTWYRALLPALGRRADRIVTDSEFSRGELTKRAGIASHMIRVVPLGAEHILAVPCDVGILATHNLGRRPFILAVGSSSRHKNVQALYQAAQYLEPGAYDVVVAGASNPRVFHATAASWAGHVKHLGYVTDGQLRALYSHAAVFVYPSLYEGFGLPPLEAMACGCPVVVARAASLPEVCGDAAAYCDPNDPLSLARSIQMVLQDESLRRDLTSRGAERAREFTWDRSARMLLSVVREICH